MGIFKRTVTLPEDGGAEHAILRVLGVVDGGASVSYSVKSRDTSRGTVTYELLGEPGPLERVYNWGVQSRVW